MIKENTGFIKRLYVASIIASILMPLIDSVALIPLFKAMHQPENKSVNVQIHNSPDTDVTIVSYSYTETSENLNDAFPENYRELTLPQNEESDFITVEGDPNDYIFLYVKFQESWKPYSFGTKDDPPVYVFETTEIDMIEQQKELIKAIYPSYKLSITSLKEYSKIVDADKLFQPLEEIEEKDFISARFLLTAEVFLKENDYVWGTYNNTYLIERGYAMTGITRDHPEKQTESAPAL